MIHKTVGTPHPAQIGDVWTDGKSFKRVLSRGGAWENVNLGSKHPDEVDHEQSAQPEAQQRDDGAEVSGGTDPVASGDGDNGEMSSVQPDGPEDTGLSDSDKGGHTDGGPNPEYRAEGEGVDGNGSPVV